MKADEPPPNQYGTGTENNGIMEIEALRRTYAGSKNGRESKNTRTAIKSKRYSDIVRRRTEFTLVFAVSGWIAALIGQK
jgi:hypothetical protein